MTGLGEAAPFLNNMVDILAFLLESQKHDMIEKFILLLYFLYCSGNFCLLSMEA